MNRLLFRECVKIDDDVTNGLIIEKVTILSKRIGVLTIISTFWDTLMTHYKTKKLWSKINYSEALQKFQVDSSKKMAAHHLWVHSHEINNNLATNTDFNGYLENTLFWKMCISNTGLATRKVTQLSPRVETVRIGL